MKIIFEKIQLKLMIIIIPFQIAISQQEIPYSVISSGGVKVISGSNILVSTVGESFIGKSFNTSNELNTGFWSLYLADQTTALEDAFQLPLNYNLEQNYPNPFNPNTTINFSLPKQTQLKLSLYNILGELVKTLAEGTYEMGYHKIVVDAVNLPSGTYIYRIESSDFVQVKKMVLIK